MMRILLACALVLPWATGCAQVMAARQPADLDSKQVLQPGIERGIVLGTLGAPLATDISPDGQRLSDTYSYTDGQTANTWGGKAGRIVLYTAGDFFTLFLTQILWMPAELALNGKDYNTIVDYRRRDGDEKWVVDSWLERDLESKKATRGGTPAVAAAPPEQPGRSTEPKESEPIEPPDVGEGTIPRS